jgi:hypothetical protein
MTGQGSAESVVARLSVRIIGAMTTAPNVATGWSWASALHRLSPFAVPRRPGEWVVDSVLFCLSLVQWWWNGLADVHPQIPDWFWPIDRAVGLFACALLWWTRRYPLATALLLLVPGSIAFTAGFPTLVGVFRLALTERVRLDGGTLVSGIEGGRFRVLVDVPGGPR